jgi:hypothetical protein
MIPVGVAAAKNIRTATCAKMKPSKSSTPKKYPKVATLKVWLPSTPFSDIVVLGSVSNMLFNREQPMAQLQTNLIELNSAWINFLQHKVNSFIKWDLVRFFHDNPHTADTAENIAGFIGRDTKTVLRELDGLVANEVLDAALISGVKVYRFSPDAQMRHLVADFVNACHNREFRVKAIHYVIHGMSFAPNHDF